jgi:hypothetical protein
MRKLLLVLAAVLFCSSAPVRAQNLVANPGFESDLTSWVIGAASFDWVSAGIGHSGSKSAAQGCIGVACMTTDPSAYGGWMYQDIPTVPGVTYTVSFWYRIPLVPPGPKELQVFFGSVPSSSSQPGTCTGSCIFDTQAHTNDLWVQVVKTVVATTNTSRFEFVGRDDPSFIFVDDVAVVPTPQTNPVPALSEWGVLGLALILVISTGLVLRRKRG